MYGDWAAVYGRGRFIRIGFGLSAPLRWHSSTKNRCKVTNDVAFRFTPGILLAGNRFDSVSFAWRIWVGTSFWGVMK